MEGAGYVTDCMTCNERNGNELEPIYDVAVDDCVSCDAYISSTPIWDGEKCTTCADKAGLAHAYITYWASNSVGLGKVNRHESSRALCVK